VDPLGQTKGDAHGSTGPSNSLVPNQPTAASAKEKIACLDQAAMAPSLLATPLQHQWKRINRDSISRSGGHDFLPPGHLQVNFSWPPLAQFLFFKSQIIHDNLLPHTPLQPYDRLALVEQGSIAQPSITCMTIDQKKPLLLKTRTRFTRLGHASTCMLGKKCSNK
jgi:hypothetical protein